MNYEAVYRTAPATPGLLKMISYRGNFALQEMTDAYKKFGFGSAPSFLGYVQPQAKKNLKCLELAPKVRLFFLRWGFLYASMICL